MQSRTLVLLVALCSLGFLVVGEAPAQDSGNVDFSTGNVQLGAPSGASAGTSGGGVVSSTLGEDPPEAPASDTDGDGMPDAWETANGFDPNDPTDATLDQDNDFLLNVEEYEFGSDPLDVDSPAFIYVNNIDPGTSPQDGTREHPYAKIQWAIDAATAPAVVKVLPGTVGSAYEEAIVMADGVWVLGGGPLRCIINAKNADDAVTFSGVSDGFLAGFKVVAGTSHWAVNATSSTVRVRRCVLTGSDRGLGVETSGSARVVNCVIADNTGRGLWQTLEGSLEVINCTIANNGYRGVSHGGTGTITLKNSIIWGNGDDIYGGPSGYTVSYCDIQDGDFSGSNGNISSNPSFVDAGAGDYRISEGSPCVDAATSDDAPTLDMHRRRQWDDPNVTDTGGGARTWYDMGACALAAYKPPSSNVIIVMQETLYYWGIIADAIDRYMDDLTREGYTPEIYVCAEGASYDCEDLRAYLKSVYDTDGLAGIVLVEAVDMGARIPRAFLQDPTDRGPLDYFYADLDGYWPKWPVDPDYYYWTWEYEGWDNWQDGDMEAEIWVGRISTIMTAGDRLNPYFDRNHAWRIGEMTFEERSLLWISSNWMHADTQIGKAYDELDSFWGGAELTDEMYHDQVQNSYEHHFVASHASATANVWITSVEIPWVNPHIGFYQEWGCMAGRYDPSMTCLMAEYVFGTDYGLVGLAWTNSGGKYPSDDQYEAIRDGETYAGAWWNVIKGSYVDGSLTQNFVDWCYGVVTFGDPTLRPQQIRITDVYWDEATSSVKVTFSSKSGKGYTLERADANAYADGLSWSTVTTTTASGKETTLADDLSTPLSADFRFYRVRRSDGTDTSRQVVGLFELDLEIGWTMQDFFISTPLIPDKDHDSVQQVIGTQIDRNAPNIRQRIADTGLNNRMVYNRTAGTWSADVGAAFDIAVGEGYKLFAGGGIAQTLTLRLTGYVAELDASVLVQKPGWTQTDRWVAYSMPQARTLDTLGLRESVTGWNSMNTLKLRALGASVWSTYKWDGAKWHNVNTPTVDAGSTPIACGEATIFTRFGTPDDEDEWAQPTWYDDPPR